MGPKIKSNEIKILNRFSNQMKHEIIMQFADLSDIPLEGVVNIAHELKKKISFLPTPKEFSRGGPRSIATLLNQMSIAEAEQYLEQIAQDDPELYTEIKKYFLSFDDLIDMPDHLMSMFWKNPELDIDALSKALKGYEQETIDHIVSFLPSRKQKMYTPVTTPLSKKDIEDAQLSIVQLAKDLAKAGELNLDDILSEQEMVD